MKILNVILVAFVLSGCGYIIEEDIASQYDANAYGLVDANVYGNLSIHSFNEDTYKVEEYEGDVLNQYDMFIDLDNEVVMARLMFYDNSVWDLDLGESYYQNIGKTSIVGIGCVGEEEGVWDYDNSAESVAFDVRDSGRARVVDYTMIFTGMNGEETDHLEGSAVFLR